MLNIQPVVPVKVTDELNLITRPIIPVIRQPDLIDGGETWGLADIELETFLSPTGTDKVTWASARSSSSRARPTAGSSGRRSGAPGQAWSC